MPLLNYTAADYATQFQRLLPRGRVWHRGLGLVQDADILALMPTWVRLTLRLNALIEQIFPCSTTELLPEWEATLGLPDECTGQIDATTQGRQAAVCAKFTARGGQSQDYYIAVAASLGFQISITQYTPFVAGSEAGTPLYGQDWAHTWLVSAQLTQIAAFEAGISTAHDPLRTWGNALLECTLNRIKPAHTILLFAYFSESIWDDGQSVWDDGDSRWDYVDYSNA